MANDTRTPSAPKTSASPAPASAKPRASDEQVMRLILRWEAAVQGQTNWRARWQDSATYIAQHKGNILMRRVEGAQEMIGIHDTTATEAAEVMAAGMLTHTMPAGEQWFQFRDKTAGNTSLSSWLEAAGKKQAEAMHSGNFYDDVFECLHDLAVFSVCAVFVDEHKDDGGDWLFNFTHIPVGTFAIEEDARGRAGAFLRKFEFTAAQCEEKWGNEKLSAQMRELLALNEQAARERKHDILHVVTRRKGGDWRPGLAPGNQREWASYYIDIGGKHIIEEGGYYEQPFAVCRLMRGNNEIYGRGPADKAMPVIKALNRLEYDRMLGIDYAVNPGWLMHHDSDYRADNRPGGETYYSDANKKPERMKVESRLDWAGAYAEEKRTQIRVAFYNPMFQMLNNPDEMKRQKTAFEVEKMLQEKLVLFSPIFGRLCGEFVEPVLHRVFGIMVRNNAFETPPPVEFDAGNYRVEYVSKIALAIKAALTNAFMGVAQTIGAISAFDPSVTLVLDMEKAVRDIARNNGLPVEWQRSAGDIEAIKQQQAQAAAMQQAQAAAGVGKDMSAAAKNLGPAGQEQALAALGGMGGMGGGM